MSISKLILDQTLKYFAILKQILISTLVGLVVLSLIVGFFMLAYYYPIIFISLCAIGFFIGIIRIVYGVLFED